MKKYYKNNNKQINDKVGGLAACLYLPNKLPKGGDDMPNEIEQKLDNILEKMNLLADKLDILIYLLENIMIQQDWLKDNEYKKYVRYKFIKNDNVDHLIKPTKNLLDQIKEG